LSAELLIRDPLGERALSAADFPLSVGGPGNTIALASLPAAPGAWIALHDGQLFLQPAEGGARLLCNGLAVTRSTWLRDGDVVDAGTGRLRIQLRGDARVVAVEDGSAGNLTLPPEPASVEVVSGGGADDNETIEAVVFRRPDATDAPRRPSLAAAAGLLGAALLAAVLWFLWTGRSIEVITHPAADSVSVHGGFPALPTGGRLFLRPGRYELVAERKGYETLRRAVVVSDATGQQFEFALQKLPGRLRVEVPVTAEVSIDGKLAGRAPGELKLRPGRHIVALSADRYLPFQTEVDIAGEDRQQVLQAKLVPAWAVLEVLSEPSAAEVRVGGEVRGATPVKLELGAGSHRVELRHSGYKDWVTDVQVVANQPQTLGPVRLGLPDARLVLRSSPVGANVSVGGAYRGRTPVEIEVRPEVALPVVIAKDGYESATSSVTLAAGESRSLDLNLAPILGELTVKGTPSNAEVLADGRSLGKIGQTYRLPSATHQLEVRAQGFHSYKASVTPRPNLPQVIEVRLDAAHGEDASAASPAAGATVAAAASGGAGATAAPAPQGPLSAVIRTKAGQELKLVPAGTFTMGSPRRESGRRANEAQRPVELRRRFYLATREVTNAEFRQFRADHRSGYVGQNTLERDKQPVAMVSWQEAAAYCNWLSALDGLPAAYQSKAGRLVPVQPMNTGYRLPTEAEWEWAARANRDGTLRKYPWGDALPVPAGAGNFADRSSQPPLQEILPDYDDGNPVSAPVGSFAPNALGFYDLGGNVAEWAGDLYTVQPATSAVAVDPLATGDGKLYVIRGSSWRHATVTELRLAYRDYGEGGRDDVGLRIARYAE
jgi:formylglycine-generating enzyme required for sulfatase activity